MYNPEQAEESETDKESKTDEESKSSKTKSAVTITAFANRNYATSHQKCYQGI